MKDTKKPLKVGDVVTSNYAILDDSFNLYFRNWDEDSFLNGYDSLLPYLIGVVVAEDSASEVRIKFFLLKKDGKVVDTFVKDSVDKTNSKFLVVNSATNIFKVNKVDRTSIIETLAKELLSLEKNISDTKVALDLFVNRYPKF